MADYSVRVYINTFVDIDVTADSIDDAKEFALDIATNDVDVAYNLYRNATIDTNETNVKELNKKIQKS